MKQIAIAILCAAVSACATATQSVVKQSTSIPIYKASYTPSPGDSMGHALKLLVERLEGAGVTVAFIPDLHSPNGGQAFGLNYGGFARIEVDATLSVNGRFEVLAHEAGHLFHGPLRDPSVGEVMAELIGVGVQEFYGVKSARGSAAGYLAQHKHAFAALPYLQKDIDLAIRVLTDPSIFWRVQGPPEEQ